MNEFFPLDLGNLKKLKSAIQKGHNSVVFYAHQNNRLHIAVNLEKPFLYIAPDGASAQKIHQILTEYSDKKIALMPEREDVFIDRKVDSLNSVFERISTLNGLIKGEIYGLVITAESLLQLYPKKNIFNDNVLNFAINTEINTENISKKLTNMGYIRTELAENMATFSIRGDILDVFPIGSEMPYRIEFFGDTVEAIKELNPSDMLCNEEQTKLEILPASDILVDSEFTETVIKNLIKAIKEAKQKPSEYIEGLIDAFRKKPSSALNTYFLPFLLNQFDNIYSYIDDSAVIILDDIKLTDDKLQLIQNSNYARLKELINDGKRLPIHKKSLFDKDSLYRFSHTILGFNKITSAISIFTPDEIFSIKTLNVPAFHLAINELYENLKNYGITGFKVRIFARDNASAKILQKNLKDNMLALPVNDEKCQIGITVGNISYGFIYSEEKLTVIGIKDYSRPVTLTKSNAHKKAIFTLPEKGDYVVHEVHGIGISEGMQKVETTSGLKDYYVILYRDGGRLYLPANQLNTIEKYNGIDTPQLHKLGGAEFERVKEKVKSSIKKMAFDLLSLYQARYNKKGYAYPPDSEWQKEMENDFEYVPTDDQLIAVSEMKNDLEQGKIMDRLLCGDVGYGKTEVAMRIMFKVIMENKQVVLLAPTTILAQQHYNLITERFQKYGVRVALLSRFVCPNEQKQVLKQLEMGTINIVVATHRILSNDVKFYDLGLLVLDEEQRFGVEQKEKLKVYKNKVNILSLSATPIPRTLHMALSGIRDISTIETPPKDRLPIQTYVTEYSDGLLINAVKKEIGRGGKVFILYNRVATIDKWFSHLKDILPGGVEIIMIHGQMKEDELSNNINDFYEGKAQVLLSTTIIENGIDLPDANTLFVLDSDRLGLGQLYQLRGRVGRSNVLAYAYFTVKENKVLTEKARKRLDALMDYTELGSGFKIAMRDLEIRGAGNVLGSEQSGQMGKVGYDMYLKLIKEGIDELKGKPSDKSRETKLNVDGDYHLEDEYITASKERVSFYRYVSLIKSRLEAREYQKKLEETYGKLPQNVIGIIRISLIKNIANSFGVKTVTINNKGCGIEFYDNSSLQNVGLMNTLADYNNYAVLVPSDTPMVIFNAKNLSTERKIKLVLDFLTKADEQRA